jgi:hypothetical protein
MHDEIMYAFLTDSMDSFQGKQANEVDYSIPKRTVRMEMETSYR